MRERSALPSRPRRRLQAFRATMMTLPIAALCQVVNRCCLALAPRGIPKLLLGFCLSRLGLLGFRVNHAAQTATTCWAFTGQRERVQRAKRRANRGAHIPPQRVSVDSPWKITPKSPYEGPGFLLDQRAWSRPPKQAHFVAIGAVHPSETRIALGCVAREAICRQLLTSRIQYQASVCIDR